MNFISENKLKEKRTVLKTMRMNALPLLLLISACSTDPQPINFGSDQCDLCRMGIADEKFSDATKAFYLHSQNFPSPMGGYLSAFETEEQLKQYQSQYGGDVWNWSD